MGRPVAPALRPRSSRRHDRGPAEPPVPPGVRTGDGVFETLRTYSGRPFLLREHAARLLRAARSIGLAPLPSPSALRHQCLAQLAVARRGPRGTEWILRPMIYAAPSGAELSVSIEPCPVEDPRRGASGLAAGVSSYPHPGRYLTPPGSSEPVKWMARGPLAHALREARGRGWDEAILEDASGRLVEGSRSNLLAVLEGTLVAPGPESYALRGITREVVLADARRLGLPVEEYAPGRRELRAATEVMLTSSLLGVAPLARVVGVWTAQRSRRRTVAAALRRAYAVRIRRLRA